MNPDIKSLFTIFDRGGPIMYPILACSIILITIIIERFYAYRKIHIDADEFTAKVAKILVGQDREQALDFTKKSPGVLPRVIESALLRFEHSQDEIHRAIDTAIQKQMPILERYIGVMGTITAIAPFLGLLGTITGMIGSFSRIAASGATGPSVIASGVYEALYTTAFGLIVAIPAVIFYNYFRSRIKDIVSEIEISGNKVIEMIMLKREGRDFPEDLL